MFFSCTKGPSPAGAPTAPLSPEAQAEQLWKKGKQSYMANCIACHNPEIKRDGVIGPAVAGASLELLRARLLTATYPEGYKPKRETKSMPAMPHLKEDIDALHSFLNQ